LPSSEHRDPDQIRAVEAKEAAIAVLAGPGSGKTRTLAKRAHYLLTKHSTDSVRLLTFTNKAAAEMKERALRVPGQSSKRLAAGTFHTFGLEVLRNHGKQVGLNAEFEIIDTDEQESLCEQAGLDDDNLFSWSYVRLRGLKATAGLLSFGKAYQVEKLKKNLVDFDDLIVYSADLLEQNAPLARAYGLKHPHLLVDEFQDTSPAQFRIVTALFPHIKTIGVFADDDQAIFEFAGAEAKNVKRFIRQLAAKELPLYTNYRCAEEIVALANRLISSNPPFERAPDEALSEGWTHTIPPLQYTSGRSWMGFRRNRSGNSERRQGQGFCGSREGRSQSCVYSKSIRQFGLAPRQMVWIPLPFPGAQSHRDLSERCARKTHG
jgi:ATP-dependent DNA helicase UvrD/PcrA